MVNYGGDEVSALVLDIGTSSLRAGYAGDDTPKAIIPTTYGYIPQYNDGDVSMNEAGVSGSLVRHYFGHSGPSLWRANMEVRNPITDGIISDFAPIPALVRHALEEVMRCSASEHPILVTEPSWNTPANRERMAEIMFEEFQVPAFYIANTSVLNTFAAGKGSALVIDIGQSVASVAPVVDGFVLRKGLQHSSLPALVQGNARNLLLSQQNPLRPPIDLYPYQLIASKQAVEANALPRYTMREDRLAGTTHSWRRWCEDREVEEWIQTVAGVLDQGWNDQAVQHRSAKQYEFPTGFNTWFGSERFGVGELFFSHPPQLHAGNPNVPKPLPNLITESLRACDPELRQVLLSNMVLTGGGSLFSGLADRLSTELSRTFPHCKIHAPGNPVERRYGGWLGGSILASLGTFHQLWISREEWQEHGKNIVGQRCK
ncbi:brg1-associated factor b [Rhodocollybia butyracea]|uniref:Brg1-associated factor b n=1 Tax=Rhodocollybia butyracea TaxID=206335 RepID=A0A9P5Q854_9AGAR|nr:brg1-associated factor b [Rhodocollybia butyracea]